MTSRIAVTAEDPNIKSRPDHWAKLLELDGVPNFYKVTDTLYRGAQPTAEGMFRLKKLRIKTVVNLRSLHSDKDEIGDIDLIYEHIRMIWHPNEEEVVQFLQIVTDTKRAPVFVHCMQGADRTGVMCAIYRVAVCGWTKEEAISEMTTGGFGYHRIWTNLIRFIEDLDIPEIKEKAKIKD
jgi:protein tyrosine/serine phosphatase